MNDGKSFADLLVDLEHGTKQRKSAAVDVTAIYRDKGG